MELTLITAGTSGGVLYSQVEYIGEKLKSGRKQIVVVPDRFSVSMEQLLLERLELSACFNLEIVSFVRLAGMVAPREKHKKVLSPQGSALIIEMLLRKHRAELKLFKGKNLTHGFASELHHTIAAFKSSGISAEDICKLAVGEAKGLNKDKLYDIAFIYQKYEQHIAAHYIDTNGLMDVLAGCIDSSSFFENSDVHFCGFNDLTAQGIAVLGSLLKRTGNVSAGVVYPGRTQPNRAAYYIKFYNKLVDIAGSCGAALQHKHAEARLRPEQAKLIENIYSYPQKQFSIQTKRYKLFNAKNIEAEVELLARVIKNKTVEGLRYKNITVVCTNLETYQPVIEQVFKLYEIPFYADTDLEFSDTELYRLIRSAMECAGKYFRRADFLAYAKNAIVCNNAADINRLELVLNQFGIEGGRLFAPLAEPQLEELRLYYMKPVNTFNKNISACKTAADFCAAVKVFLDETKASVRLEQLRTEAMKLGDIKAESVLRQQYNKLIGILELIEQVLGDSEPDLNEFIRLFDSASKNAGIVPLPMSADSVFIGQAGSSVFMQNRLFWLLGCTSEMLPVYTRDTGLLSDNEVRIINASYKLSPGTKDINTLARQDAIMLLAGSDECCLSYPRQSSGSEAAPSSIVAQISGMFDLRVNPAEEIYAESAMGNKKLRAFTLGAPLPALNRLSLELRTEKDGEGNLPPDAGSIREMLRAGKYAPVLDVVIKNCLNAGHAASIENAAEVFLPLDTVRVTQAERYFECPYKHFVVYGLKLGDNKTADLQAADAGNILHRFAEKFVAAAAGNNIAEKDILSVATELFNEIMCEPEFEHFAQAAQNEFVIPELRAEAGRLAAALCYQLENGKFKPKYLEAAFGSDEALPRLEFNILNKTITVKGKLDRADFFGSKCRVIDYKTGRNGARFNFKELYLGKKLQLFIYLYALTKDGKAQAAGAFYLPVTSEFEDSRATKFSAYKLNGVTLDDLDTLLLHDKQVCFEHPKSDIVPFEISTSKENKASGELKANSNKAHLTDTQFRGCIKYAAAMTKNAISEIAAGNIAAKPLRGECNYCKFFGVCRRDVLTRGNHERSGKFDVTAEILTKAVQDEL
ncbi:MAG: PD-(D/E)XK nuclease family protein [Firmicutes bacterium]|nr:PD-(D/E)XK nuclease family protein [Bacillota bacterium]